MKTTLRVSPDDGLKDFSTIGLDGLPDYAVQEVPRDLFFVYKSSGVLVGDIFIGLALFFGVISVILCWYLTTASLKFKEKAFGVLRSVGAGERCVRQIALTEIAFLAVCIFLLALVLTAGLYFGFLNAPSAVVVCGGECPASQAVHLHGVDGAHFGGAVVWRAAAVLRCAAQKVPQKIYCR